MTETMTDGPTHDPGGGAPGGPGGSPPWAGPPGALAGIQRLDDERWVAGVAGGVARYLGIETWIVRTLAVGLAIIGIGVPLYILGWLLLPSESRPSIATERQWNRNTVIAVCALVIVGSLALIGPGDVSTPWRALPWVIVAVGVLLLVRPGPGSTLAPSAPTGSGTGGLPAMAPPPPPDPTVPTGAEPTGAVPPPPSVPPAPRPPRKVSLLTPLTLFGLIALVGLSVLVGADGVARPGVVAALSLCIIGSVVLLSSVIGRARGLTVVGVLVAVPLVFGLAAGSRWGDWRNVTYRPTSATPFERTYERGMGRTTLDLRQLELPRDDTARIKVEQLAGEVVIWLPPDATTELEADVVAGEVVISDGVSDDGAGVELDRNIITGDGSGDLFLQVDLVAGQVDVRWEEPSSESDSPTVSFDPTTTVPADATPTTTVPAPAAPSVPTTTGGPR